MADNYKFITEHSIWWLLPAVACSVFFALFLYRSKREELSKSIFFVLITLRALLFFTLFLLLINPLFHYFKNKINPPQAVIVLDNSLSVASAGASRQQLFDKVNELTSLFQEKGVTVQTVDLQGRKIVDSLQLSHPVTDLDKALSWVGEQFEGQNLVAVTLITDGIVNQGQSPYYKKYPMRIHAIGLGDTLSYADAAISKVNVNAVSFVSKKIPIEVLVETKGMLGKRVKLILSKNGEEVASRYLDVIKDEQYHKQLFYVTESKAGIFSYHIAVEAEDERHTKNNYRQLFLKVVDKTEKILVLGERPHPDMKFIREILAQNEGREVQVSVLSFNKNDVQNISAYDLVVLHGFSASFFEKYTSVLEKAGRSYMLFSGSEAVNVAGVSFSSKAKDEVQVSLNTSFKSVVFSGEMASAFQQTPPLVVPFGEIKTGASAEVLAYQRVGSLTTDKPLVVLQNKQSHKTALVMGDGWWKIRLRNNENVVYFDEFFAKIVQYTLTNQNENRIRIQSLQEEYTLFQEPKIDIKTYDALGEPTTGENLHLSLRKEGKVVKEINTSNSSVNYQYILNGLESGVYSVLVEMNENGKKYRDETTFSVTDYAVEEQVLTPRLGDLKRLAHNHQGVYYAFHEKDMKKLFNGAYPSGIITVEDVFSIIEYNVLLFFVLALVFAEWILRKIKLLD